jgi:hypothetical protein
MLTTSSFVAFTCEMTAKSVQFLDWPRIPQWHQGFIKSIDPLAQKTTIEPGDTLKVVLQGSTYTDG